MIKPIKEIGRETRYEDDHELVKKQRQLLISSLVKDFYPSKFNASHIIQKRDSEKTGGR